MKFRVLTGFCIETGKDVSPGDIVELDSRFAVGWVQAGRLEPVVDAVLPAEGPSAPEHRETAPRRRGKEEA